MRFLASSKNDSRGLNTVTENHVWIDEYFTTQFAISKFAHMRDLRISAKRTG